VYEDPNVNPVTVIGEVAPFAVCAPEDVTIYEFAVGPVVGAVNAIEAVVDVNCVATTDVGAFGVGAVEVHPAVL